MTEFLSKMVSYYKIACLKIEDLREALFIWGILLVIVVFIIIPWIIGIGTYFKMLWRLTNG